MQQKISLVPEDIFIWTSHDRLVGVAVWRTRSLKHRLLGILLKKFPWLPHTLKPCWRLPSERKLPKGPNQIPSFYDCPKCFVLIHTASELWLLIIVHWNLGLHSFLIFKSIGPSPRNHLVARVARKPRNTPRRNRSSKKIHQRQLDPVMVLSVPKVSLPMGRLRKTSKSCF